MIDLVKARRMNRMIEVILNKDLSKDEIKSILEAYKTLDSFSTLDDSTIKILLETEDGEKLLSEIKLMIDNSLKIFDKYDIK